MIPGLPTHMDDIKGFLAEDEAAALYQWALAASALGLAAPAVADSLLRPGKGSILSTQVERFMLTNGIAKREPQAGIEAIRPDSANNDMVTVYAFSEVSGLQGQTLRYRWSRNDKVVATVKVGVGGNSWRSYSSKFISSTMQGNWRVELLDASDGVLAFREFDY